MSFATNGNGNGKGAPLRPEDYTPIWPMVPGTRKISVTINGQREVLPVDGRQICPAAINGPGMGLSRGSHPPPR